MTNGPRREIDRVLRVAYPVEEPTMDAMARIRPSFAAACFVLAALETCQAAETTYYSILLNDKPLGAAELLGHSNMERRDASSPDVNNDI